MTAAHQAQIDWLINSPADPPVHIVSRLAAEFELRDDPTIDFRRMEFLRWMEDNGRSTEEVD